MSDDILKSADEMIARLTQQKLDQENEDASLGLDAFWGSGSSTAVSCVRTSGLIENGKLDTSTTSPVGNENVPETNFHIDFGFGNNVEKDEDGNSFEGWAENRNFRRDVFGYIEAHYHSTGRLPEYNALHSAFEGYPERPRYIKGWRELLDSFAEGLEARGLPAFNTADNYLDPGFIAAVHLIANKTDTRTIAAKLKQCNIKTAQWSGFLKKKKYLEYYKAQIQHVFQNETAIEAETSLDTLVRQGDLQAIKYYNEVTGIYRTADSSTTQATVGAILAAVLEILARKVSTDILNDIAYEIRTTKPIQELMGVIETQAS